MTNHLSNLLNQHTWMAQSKLSLFANCTGWECAFVSKRERGRRKKHNRKNESVRDRGRFSSPYVQLHLHRVIKNRLGAAANGQERLLSWNSREQSHDLSGGRAGVGRRAIELIQIYIVENSICPFRSSNCFRFTRHQSNLFVGAHQDVRPGLHTVIPIQFAPSVPHVLTVA